MPKLRSQPVGMQSPTNARNYFFHPTPERMASCEDLPCGRTTRPQFRRVSFWVQKGPKQDRDTRCIVGTGHDWFCGRCRAGNGTPNPRCSSHPDASPGGSERTWLSCRWETRKPRRPTPYREPVEECVAPGGTNSPPASPKTPPSVEPCETAGKHREWNTRNRNRSSAQRGAPRRICPYRTSLELLE